MRVFKVTWVKETGTALELINNLSIDIILIDLSVTNDKSTVFVQQILQNSPTAFIILLGSTNNRAIAMQTIAQGAYDVIDKQCLGKNWLVRILGYNLLRAEDFKFKQGSTKTLYRICNTSRLGIMVSDLFGSIIYTNGTFNRITGYSAAKPLRHHWTARIGYEDRMRLLREWQDAQKDDQFICSDVCLLHQYKQECEIRITGTPIDKLEKSYGYIVTVEGLTEQVNKAKLMSPFTKNKAKFLPATTAQLTLDAMSDAILSTDINSKVLYMNHAASLLTVWEHHEAVGCLLTDIFNIKESATAGSADSTLSQSQRYELTIDCILIRKDGVELQIEESARSIVNELGQNIGAVFIFRDVTQSQLNVLKMTHLAQHDPLTELPNRLLFEERLNQAIVLAKRHNKKLAVLYLDIDLFKEINDLHGHELGDKLLCSVAKRMTDAVRLSDTVCRQGGDEFLILLSEIEHTNDAATFCRKLLHSLIEPHQIKDKKISLQMSIGICIFPHDGEINDHKDSEEKLSDVLIDHADKAMYQAKLRGHDGYQFFT
tara:strand:- start:257 stop:1885 length:1629 start_codon:yes stop_codon:yes gene_type:complete